MQALSRQAGQWFEEHGMISEAVESALQAQDSERMVGLIERVIEAARSTRLVLPLPAQEIRRLRRWLEQVPNDVLVRYPELCFGNASVLLYSFVIEEIPLYEVPSEPLSFPYFTYHPFLLRVLAWHSIVCPFWVSRKEIIAEAHSQWKSA
jgi:hypothetical protein